MDILICDDEALATQRLSRLVEQLGHHVVAVASHGQQAIELTEFHQPDVVLLDIQMPEMDGLTCAEHLRQLDPMPAIVFCTAYDEHALEAFRMADGYLLKPIMQLTFILMKIQTDTKLFSLCMARLPLKTA